MVAGFPRERKQKLPGLSRPRPQKWHSGTSAAFCLSKEVTGDKVGRREGVHLLIKGMAKGHYKRPVGWEKSLQSALERIYYTLST